VKLRSIRLRLVVVNALALALALAAAAWGLALLFDRHAERVALSALAARADALTSALERDPGGTLRFLAPSGDPAYQQPLSGHYWQVSFDGRLLRSRSLWDYVLPLPEDAPSPARTGRPLTLPGPQGEALLVLDRTVQIGPARTRPGCGSPWRRIAPNFPARSSPSCANWPRSLRCWRWRWSRPGRCR
jgi:hypothetical protein